MLCGVLFKYANWHATPCDVIGKLLLVLLCLFEINLSMITTLDLKPLFRLSTHPAPPLLAAISGAAARSSPACLSLDPEVTPAAGGAAQSKVVLQSSAEVASQRSQRVRI